MVFLTIFNHRCCIPVKKIVRGFPRGVPLLKTFPVHFEMGNAILLTHADDFIHHPFIREGLGVGDGALVEK